MAGVSLSNLYLFEYIQSDNVASYLAIAGRYTKLTVAQSVSLAKRYTHS